MSIDYVVVVGAGMVGLSTAYFLQGHGVRVTVIDRTGVAAGSPWGNAGWITPALTLPLPELAVLAYGIKSMLTPNSPLYIPLRWDPRLIRFLMGFARACAPAVWRSSVAVYLDAARSAVSAFDELTDGAVDEPTHRAEPFLAAFGTLETRKKLIEEFRMVTDAGNPVDYDLVSGDEMRSIEPMLGSGVVAGVRPQGQNFIDPPKFVEALADAVRRRGGEVVSGFNVLAVHDSGAAGVEVVPRSGDAVVADAAVIATGAWMSSLPRKFGVRQLVQAGRGYSFSVIPETMPTRPVYLPTACALVE